MGLNTNKKNHDKPKMAFETKTAKATGDYATIVMFLMLVATSVSVFAIYDVDSLTLGAIWAIGVGVLLVNEALFESKAAKGVMDYLTAVGGVLAVVYGFGVIGKVVMVLDLMTPVFKWLVMAWLILFGYEIFMNKK